MSVTLWNGWSTFALTSLHNNAQTCGLAWATSEDRTCTGCRFYRLSGMPSGQLPTRARVWRNSDGHVMADLALAPSTGADGWIDFEWTVPFTAVASAQYRLGIDFPGTFSYDASNPTSAAPSPPVPLSLQANGKYVQEPPGFPDSTSSLWFGVDVVLSGDALAGSGGTAGTGGSATTGDLNAWLSDVPTVNTHQSDGLPWLTKADTAATRSTADSLLAQAQDWASGLGSAAHGYFGDVKALISAVKSVTDTLPTPIARLSAVVLDHYSADVAVILAEIDSVIAGLDALTATTSGTGGSALGSTSGRSPFAGSGWSLTAESDFDTSLAFDQAADAYALHITSYRPTQPASSVAAGLWLYRVGWWCVLTGSFGSQRAYIDFQQQLLTDQGRRMPGCAIQLKPGTLATVQAWSLA